MDSSLEINTSNVSSKAFVDDKLNVFSKILDSLEKNSSKAKAHLLTLVKAGDKIDNKNLEKYQFEAHGFACFETYRIALRETLNWYKTLLE